MTSPSSPVQPGASPDRRPFPPAPGQPPRKRRTWLIVLVTVATLMLAVCGFGGVRLFLGIKNVTDIDKEVNKVTAAFIEDARDGLSPAEFDGLCAEAKEEFSQQDLAAPKKDKVAVTGYRVTDTNVDYDRRQATVHVEFQRTDGSTTEEIYILDEDADKHWKMCAFPS